MPSSGRYAPATALRTGLLLLCAVLSVLTSGRTYAALPVALLGALALLADRVPLLRRHPLPVALAEACLAGSSVALTGDAESPMLPYLLAAPTCVGLAAGLREVGVTGAMTLAALVGATVLDDGVDAAGLRAVAPPVAQWLLIGTALGLVATRARLLQDRMSGSTDRYAEARALLQQLRAVSRRLPGGLDAPSSAEALLERCSEAVPRAARSAVLLQPAPGVLVPVAVRGTRRVPWRAPLDEAGPLQDAWSGVRTVVDRRAPDAHGRRKGSALVVVPLTGEGGPLGLVVVEAFDAEALGPEEVAAVEALVAATALQLETAMLFEELRSAVSVAERDRLAREMHDGVAQELAFVGYALDDLRSSAARVDDGLAAKVAEVRGNVTALVSNLRLSITDLRTSVSPDRGLGSALSSYVRAVGSGGRLAVHLTLDESAFRLPGDQEVLLLQVAQAVAQDARRNASTRNLWVRLTVDPPAATLLVEHDGPDERHDDLASLEDALRRASGSLVVSRSPHGGARVVASLGGGAGGRHGHAGR